MELSFTIPLSPRTKKNSSIPVKQRRENGALSLQMRFGNMRQNVNRTFSRSEMTIAFQVP